MARRSVAVTLQGLSAAGPAPNEDPWRRLALAAVDTISFCDADGTVVALEHDATDDPDVLGHGEQWWSGRSGFELLHPDDVDAAAALWADCVAHPGSRRRLVLRMRHAGGRYEHVELTALNLLDDPAVEAVVVATRFVSQQVESDRLVSDEARVLELVAGDAPPETVWHEIASSVEHHTAGTAGVVLHTDGEPGLHVAAAGTGGDLLRGVVARLLSDGHPSGTRRLITRPVVITDVATDPRTRSWGTRLVERDATDAVRALWAQPIVEDEAGAVRGAIVVVVSEPRPPTAHQRRVVEVAAGLAGLMTQRSRWQDDLRARARTDPLTGLPNRTAIFEHVDAALAEARVNREPVTAMVVDLDRFKLVNDSLGHAVGDRLLSGFADRLREVMDVPSPTETTSPGRDRFVGRIAADEFVVLLPGTRLGAAELAAARLRRALEEPFTAGDDEIHLSASIGLAMSSLGRERADTLVQRADAAMFRAKAGGRDRIEVYDERMRTQATTRLEIDRELRVALERGELQLHYQPQIDGRTRRIIGAEALLRWEHHTMGLIRPDRFVNVAEESGSIVPIGHWVLDEAVRQARRWTDAHPHIEPFAIGVNLSARQLINRSLVDTVAFVLTRYDWPPSSLVLELTESILIEDRDATLYVLNRLRQLGVELAVDDFGTGFASLDYLHRLHVDWIKIDRSFVEHLDAEGNGSPVARAMMHMARAFDLSVIAEGVEEQRQLDGLRALGCDVVQGFLFARPMPAADLEALLRRDRPLT